MKETVVIFGATGGLGKGMTDFFQDKYNVISLGSKDVDVSDREKVKEFFNANEVDIVLNFSGINYDSFMHKYDDSNIDKVDELIAVNIKGTANILNCCLPKMRAKKYGRIVLISSILAEAPVVSTGVYSGCKGFLDSIAKTVALENANKNISCNTIQLGYFDAGLTYRIPENIREHILKSIPVKRFGSLDELGKLVEMLINVPYITGTSIKINGGLNF